MADKAAMRIDLGLELADAANATWSAGEWDRNIEQAVEELSRLFPLKSVTEIFFDKDVASESWATESTVTNSITLANRAIKARSETVTSDPAGTTFVRNTDYTMDYLNGVITPTSAGDLVLSTSYLISYTKDQRILDLNVLLTNAIRVVALEYMINDTPQHFQTWEIHGDFLTIL